MSTPDILAEGLNLHEIFEIDLDKVQTNIVVIYLKEGKTAVKVIEKMNSIGIRAVAFGDSKIRIVAHLDVSETDCHEAVTRISEAFG